MTHHYQHITEAEFQQTVIDLARTLGWLVFHAKDSRRSETGFLDLLLVSQEPMPPRLLFMELKKEGGKLTKGRCAPRSGRQLPGQEDWVKALARCSKYPDEIRIPGSPVEVYVFYPHDMDTIEKVLR